MASVKTTRELIRLCRESDVTLFIWGLHGIGKSAIVASTAHELGIEMVDLRCAQLDAVDLRGFPDKGSDGRTHFLPPAELPSDGSGILMLDELNRGNPDVLAAAFQLVLDRRIGEYRLPPGWSIVCAGNFDGSDYAVTELDPAFRDRFCHIVLEAGPKTSSEWAQWMMRTHGSDAYSVVNFCTTNARHLEDIEQSEALSFTIQPSRRSWDAITRGMKRWSAGSFSDECRLEFLSGLVGPDLAASFIAHRPTFNPQDIVDIGVRRVRVRLNKCPASELSAIMWGLIGLHQVEPENVEVLETLLDYCDYLLQKHPDLSVALCNAVLAHESSLGISKARTALLANTRLGKAVARLQDSLGEQGLLSGLSERNDLHNRLAEVLNNT